MTYIQGEYSGRQWGTRLIPQVMKVLITAMLMASQVVTSARADDFDTLMDHAEASKTVRVLVTGWQAITGDEPLPGAEQGPDAWVSITGDEFVKELQQVSNQTKVVRRYEKLPVIALQLDAAALSAAKAMDSSVKVWVDAENSTQLVESTRMIGADAAWSAGYTGAGRAVVVIDTGTDTNHPFLRDKTVLEACFSDRCPNGKKSMVGKGAAKPVKSHGTHVAGIALGKLESGKLSGVGPDLSLIAINVFNSGGGARDSSILAALDYILALAEKRPEMIGAVNMSLGSSRKKAGVCRNDFYDDVSKRLRKAGIPIIVASGNDGKSNAAAPVGAPACIDGFISVGAVNKNGQVASFSNSGPTLDFLAPGVEILSSIPQGSKKQGAYDRFPGTSMAAPHVAAAMAVLKQAMPDRSVDELVLALKKSGTPVRDARTNIVAPIINIGRAIVLLNGGNAPPKNEPPKSAPDNNGAPKKKPVKPAPLPIKKIPAPEKRNDGWNAITG